VGKGEEKKRAAVSGEKSFLQPMTPKAVTKTWGLWGWQLMRLFMVPRPV
jgi:hypothetical protein